MGHGYIENGEVEGEGKEADIRKRLVMSMSSVTSFVESHWVSMKTVKSRWESDWRH